MALLKSRLVLGLCIVGFVLYVSTVAAAERAEPSAGQEGNPDLQGEPLPTATASKAHTSGSEGQQQQQQTPLLSKGYLQYEEHKALLPIGLKDVVLFLLSFMVLSLAAGAGIGGGVLLVPMLSLITGFGSIQTVALSNVTIFAGAITNMLFNVPRKHPFKAGPIIDYDLLLLFGPPIVMGSIAGSYINYFVPGWVTKTLVLLVLAPMTWRMVTKAKLLWVAETRRASHGLDGPPVWSSSLVNSLELVSTLHDDKDPQKYDSNHRYSGAGGPAAVAAAIASKAAPTHADTKAAVDAVQAHQQQLAPVVTSTQHHHGVTIQPSVLMSPFGTSAAHHRVTAHRATSLPHEHSHDRMSHLRINFSQQSPTRTNSHTHGHGLHGHGHSHMLASLHLSDRPPTSLADLLGPYFLLLTTPQAADATLQAQALSRALNLQHSTLPLQHSSSVTRRHTLDAPQHSPSHKHSGSGSSRPSSAPTVPSDWEVEMLPHDGTTSLSTVDSNPLSIISPFQLYQQQRCQHKAAHEPHASDSGGGGGGEQQQQQQPLSPQPEAPEELPVAAAAKCRKLVHKGCVHTKELEDKMRHVIEHHATTQVPKEHLAALLLMLATVTVTSVLATLKMTCGTYQYWMVVLTPMPLMMIVWAVMRWHVLWRVGWQNVLGLTHSTDIKWTPTSTLTYPAIVITVGVMAGMLGLGGGIVLAPLLLELGVQPAVSAASSQAAMLMSSCTSTVVYLVNAALPKDYGTAMAIIGFTGTLFGQVVFNIVVQRTGRSSILVLILAVLFMLASGAAVVVISNAITAIVHTPAKLTATHALEVCTMRGG